MRLQQFSLDLFGHFSSKTFDFGKAEAGRSDFHVIYGPNEAGKTTTMEAFMRLLFGFPHREPYDFMHQRKNLQVSGVLEIDGKQLGLSRLPVRTGSLRDRNETVLPETALQSHLGGLSEQDYRQLLCLDDETIERGGEQIVSSNGDIGRLLFSAAAGVSDLSGVLEQFKSKADGLYRKRASSTEMAKLKKDLAEVERQIKELDVPASTYRKLKHALEVSRSEEETVRTERSTLHKSKATLDTLKSALPILAEIDALEAELAPFSEYPKRLDFNPEELVELLNKQSQLLADEKRLGDDIADFEFKLKNLERQPEHLSLLDELERFDDLRSRHATADLDLEKRRNTLREIHDDMARAASDLQATDGTPTETLVLSPAQINQLEQVRERIRDAKNDVAGQQKEIDGLRARIDDAEELVGQVGANEAPNAVIGPILNRYSVDMLAPRYASAKEALRLAATALADALSGLAFKDQTFDEAPTCPITADDAEELGEHHRASNEMQQKLTIQCDELQLEIDTLKQRIAHLKVTSGIVDDEAAQSATAERDQLWQNHKGSLSETTASTFEDAMHAVDTISETRLGHATELGQLRHEEQRLLELEVRLKFNGDKKAELDNELLEIQTLVTGYAESAGLPGEITPARFAKWVTYLDLVKQAAATFDRLKEERDSTISEANRLIGELRAVLALETEDFETVVAEARKREAEERIASEEQQEAIKGRDTLNAEMKRRQTAMKDLEGKAEAREEEWATLVEDFFGDGLDANCLVHSLEPLRTVRELEVRRVTADRQVTAMEKDQSDFAQEISKLCAKAGLDATLPPLEAFKSLKTLGDTAHAAEDCFTVDSASLTTAREELGLVEDALQKIDQQVSDLATLFPADVPTNTLPELRSAVNEAQSAIEKRENCSKLVSKICTELDVPDIEAARLKLDGASLSDLTASLMTADEDLEAIDQRLETAIETRTAAQKDLSAVTGDADVAALTERKATLEAEIEETALKYLETDFGLRLAEEAIRRYRDSHRSSMMDATEKAFSELTNGTYTRLITRPEGQSEILLALDAAGMAKQAHDMSKGTRFQLYLALRAAAYEQLASQGVCLPFFCDDVFETFDEERTQAACRVMERIGKTGQAIYLTHHRHVVEIAKDVCSSGVVVHEL